MKPNPSFPALLLLLAGGYGYAMVDGGVHLLKPPPTPVAASTATAAPVVLGQAAQDPSLIPRKNVFDPQRTPWTVPVVPPPPPPEPPPPPPISDADVMIQGVLITDTMRKAIVALSSKFLAQFQQAPGKTTRPYQIVKVGDVLSGYRIVSIDPKEIVFEQAGSRSTLPFNVAKGRPAAGASVPPPEQVALMVPVTQPTILGDAGALGTPAAAGAPADPATAATAAAPAPTAAPAAADGTTNDPGKQASPAIGEVPKQGMTLLEAIEFARRNQTAPVANPFTNPLGNK